MPGMVPVVGRIVVAVACVAMGIGVVGDAANAAGRVVGEAGDLRRVELVGIRQCDPVQVRRAMRADLELQAAARPSAPLEPFVDALERRLTAGYRHSGFADATVDAQYDATTDAVTAYVHEGRLYRRREIRVSGGSASLRSELVKRLRQAAPERPWLVTAQKGSSSNSSTHKEIVWKRGGAAGISETTPRTLQEQVGRRLDDLGYPDAKFVVNTELDRPAGACDLVVQIKSLGDQAKIGNIEVRGLSRHTREQVLAYLKLKTGDPLDDATLSRVHQRLRDSCRFWKYELGVYRAGGEGGRYDDALSRGESTLVLNLIEYTKTPPLGESLSEVDQTLARLALELSRNPAGVTDKDLQIVDQSGPKSKGRLTTTLSSTEGMAFESEGAALGVGLDFNGAGVFGRSEAALFDWGRGASWARSWSTGIPIVICASVQPDGRGDGEEEFKSRLKLDVHKSGDGADATAATGFTLRIEPVAMVHAAHRRDANVTNGVGTIHVEFPTGSLVIAKDPAAVQSFQLFSKDGEPTFKMELKKDAWQGVERRIAKRRRELPAGATPTVGGDSVAAGLEFLAASLLAQPAVKNDPVKTIAIKFVVDAAQQGWFRDQVAIAGLDSLFASPAEPSRTRFCMERDVASGTVVKWPKVGGVFGPLNAYGPFGSHLHYTADISFPRKSWPWTLTRELGFRWAEERVEIDVRSGRTAEIRRMLEDEPLGPLAALAVEYCATQGVIPAECADEAIAAIDRGRRHGALHDDLQVLTCGEHGFARAARTLFGAYAELSAKERKLLVTKLPPAVARLLQSVDDQQARFPDQPLGLAIEDAAREEWDRGLADLASGLVHRFMQDAEVLQAGAHERLDGGVAAAGKGESAVRQARTADAEKQIK